MLDTSLSMQGDKLARAFESVEYFLHGLTPRDRFNLLLFNSDTSAFSDEPLSATPDEVVGLCERLNPSRLPGRRSENLCPSHCSGDQQAREQRQKNSTAHIRP